MIKAELEVSDLMQDHVPGRGSPEMIVEHVNGPGTQAVSVHKITRVGSTPF